MDITKTMRGFRLEEFNKPYVYHDNLPVPTARPGEILMKVKAASFCHTELAAMSLGFSSSHQDIRSQVSLACPSTRSEPTCQISGSTIQSCQSWQATRAYLCLP
ncbi:hypothetical protein FRC08_016683, partial [Ceratobasidium sp. 394]